MTNNTLRSTMYNHLDPFAVGFDRVFDRLSSFSAPTTNYPPYNIIKASEDRYLIEMAVAGFDLEDFDIELHEGVLTIKADVGPGDPETNYIHKGIAARSFERKFTLADTIEVEGASLHMGMLTIMLKNIVPEEKKPKRIELSAPKVEKQLLNEKKEA